MKAPVLQSVMKQKRHHANKPVEIRSTGLVILHIQNYLFFFYYFHPYTINNPDAWTSKTFLFTPYSTVPVHAKVHNIYRSCQQQDSHATPAE